MTAKLISARTTIEPQWTSRQREVLDLLAAGVTNREIAERLGIGLDGAKWHVSEILTRSGFDSREEVADYWRQRKGLRGRLRDLKGVLLVGTMVKVSAAVALVAMAGIAFTSALWIWFTPSDDHADAPSGVFDATSTMSPGNGLPPWSEELSESARRVAAAFTSDQPEELSKLLHFRAENGSAILYSTHCEGGAELLSSGDVLAVLLKLSSKSPTLSEAVRANEDSQSSNIVHFLVFKLQAPDEPIAIAVDDIGVVAIYTGCTPNAQFFAGNGNAHLWP